MMLLAFVVSNCVAYLCTRNLNWSMTRLNVDDHLRFRIPDSVSCFLNPIFSKLAVIENSKIHIRSSCFIVNLYNVVYLIRSNGKWKTFEHERFFGFHLSNGQFKPERTIAYVPFPTILYGFIVIFVLYGYWIGLVMHQCLFTI